MKRLFATDLDGTILPHEGSFHKKDLHALQQMGEQGIVRVVATGRSLYYAFQALDADFPIDYLVFSSGAGVFDWRKKKILRTLHLNRSQVSGVQSFLHQKGLGYTLHRYIPDNHCFWYKEGNMVHPDLNRFVRNRIDFATPIERLGDTEDAFCQMLTILDEPREASQFFDQLHGVKVIRATSPIDGKSIWMEIFHQQASKANGIQMVCNLEQVNQEGVWVLGNDYNDLDMLHHFHPRSYVVANAPDQLKQKFQVVPSVNEAGMSNLVSGLLI